MDFTIDHLHGKESAFNTTLLHMHPFGPIFTASLATFFICIMIGGVVFNVMLVYTICRNKALRTIKNYLIVNLATCDLLRVIANLPFEPDYLLRGYFNYGVHLCGWKEVVFMFSLPSSIINMLLLTLERVIVLLYPFEYRRHVTKRRVFFVLCVSWLYFILATSYPFMVNPNVVHTEGGHCLLDFHLSYAYYQVIGNFLIPLIVILIMNCLIFRIAASHSKNQRKLSDKSDEKRTNKFFSNYKAAKTIMIIVANVATCWLAYIIIVIVNFSCWSCHSEYVTYIGRAINCTSVATNPILYGLLNASIRNIVIGWYRRVCCFFIIRPHSSMGGNTRLSVCEIVRQKWKRETVTSVTSTFLLDVMEEDKCTTQV